MKNIETEISWLCASEADMIKSLQGLSLARLSLAAYKGVHFATRIPIRDMSDAILRAVNVEIEDYEY